MVAVSVDHGGFPLMRNVNFAHQPNRTKVYTAWFSAFSYNVPDAMANLADVIEDVYRYELWKDRQLDTPEAFFENLGLFGLGLEEPAKLIRELRKKHSTKKAEIQRRAVRAMELRDQGLTQREIAAELGVSQQTVSVDMALPENDCRQQKSGKPKARDPRVQISPKSDLTARAGDVVRVLGRDRAREFATLLLEATGG